MSQREQERIPGNVWVSKSNRAVGVPVAHESAHKHVAGEALYVDDIPEPRGLLHVYMYLTEHVHARIKRMDLSAVRAAAGVAAVVSADDLRHTTNDISPVRPGDTVFADGEVMYCGQPLFAVAAHSIDAARRAARCVAVEYEDLPAILTVEEALQAGAEVGPSVQWTQGDPDAVIAAAPHRASVQLRTGGQEHFYLEGQVAMAIPHEDGDMMIYSSTQGPAHVQAAVAKVLGVPYNTVTVENRRMGGGFGGKETQCGHYAAIAALVAQKTGRPAKLRLDRDDDIITTGKRHPFVMSYTVGFDDHGRILGMDILHAVDCGYAADLSEAVARRGMYHADGAYFLDNVRITTRHCLTNKQSNTAFRGFGGPQGAAGIEQVIQEIARRLGMDPLSVRKINQYGVDERNVTPYGQTVEGNILPVLMAQLERRVDYQERRRAIDQWNAANPYIKKGMALTPVKFGIAFSNKFQNQGGALVLVYLDGTVQVNHGGTDMGQGLHTKVAQVVAEVFGIDLECIRITATTTGKVPNTSPTSASTGADLNCAAAYNAATTIINNLTPVVREHFSVADDTPIVLRDNAVYADERRLGSFREIVNLAYMSRVPLSSTGYYSTPGIVVDAVGRGRPFQYFAYGAAYAEVLVDTLTGEYKMTRVDIVHDVGRSLNPAIDLGQIEGGFMQGVGWLTSEELYWDPQGRIRTHSPSTYKIPTCSDLPDEFHVEIYADGRNVEQTIYRSKAVGEPPLLLSFAVLFAIKDAVESVADHRRSAPLDAPATPEAILMAIEAVRRPVEPAAPTASRDAASIESAEKATV